MSVIVKGSNVREFADWLNCSQHSCWTALYTWLCCICVITFQVHYIILYINVRGGGGEKYSAFHQCNVIIISVSNTSQKCDDITMALRVACTYWCASVYVIVPCTDAATGSRRLALRSRVTRAALTNGSRITDERNWVNLYRRQLATKYELSALK